MREGEHLRRLGVAPLMKISGANGSASAKPRNSRGSRRRRLLLPTTPLAITRTPSASACPMKCRSASGPGGEPTTLLEIEPENMPHGRGDLDDIVLEVGGANEAKRRARAWTRRSRDTSPGAAGTDRRSPEDQGLDGPRGTLAMARKSGIGMRSIGGSSRKRSPTGVRVAFANASTCLRVGCTPPRSHSSSLGSDRSRHRHRSPRARAPSGVTRLDRDPIHLFLYPFTRLNQTLTRSSSDSSSTTSGAT